MSMFTQKNKPISTLVRTGSQLLRRGKKTGRASAAGFSMIELLLALALGLVIITGIVQLFVGNSQTYSILNGQARLQENARFGFEFISRAARTAGYFGCAPEPDNIVQGLRGAWNAVPEYNVTMGVQGFEAGTATWTPGLGGLPQGVSVNIAANAIDTSVIAPGTDVVVFRSIQEPVQRLTTVLQPDGDPVITAPGGNPGIVIGDVVIVADCEQAAVFRVTGRTIAGSTATLAHATPAAGNRFQNDPMVLGVGGSTPKVPATLSVIGRSYGKESTVGAVQSDFFFIAPSVATDNRGNPVLALWQKSGSGAPRELVQGVEDLQVLYGVDTTLNDNIVNANQYFTFDNVPDPRQIVSVRVTLTANSVDAISNATDPYLRRTFTKTILLRNAAPQA